MRRLAFILFFFLCALGVKAQFTNVVVGTTANDGTGDSARLAFQKLNFADNYHGRIKTIYATDPAYGAVGDYSGTQNTAGTGIDNRAAIQAALDAAYTQGPGGVNDTINGQWHRVVLPNGKYWISARTDGLP